MTYQKALHKRKDQCDFKSNTKYTANEAREKLGRSDGKIYTNSQDHKGILLMIKNYFSVVFLFGCFSLIKKLFSFLFFLLLKAILLIV